MFQEQIVLNHSVFIIVWFFLYGLSIHGQYHDSRSCCKDRTVRFLFQKEPLTNFQWVIFPPKQENKVSNIVEKVRKMSLIASKVLIYSYRCLHRTRFGCMLENCSRKSLEEIPLMAKVIGFIFVASGQTFHVNK